MRLALTILKWFGLGLLLLIVSLLALPWLPVAADQFGKGAYRTYLDENAQLLDPAKNGQDVTFDPDFYDSRLILLSEIHGFAPPQQVDLALVKHLAENVSGLTYFAEMDPAQAIVVNDYLMTGDDAELRGIFDRWYDVNAQWANKEFFAKIVALRDWNQTRAPEDQVFVVGVDRPQDRGFAEMIAQRPAIALAPDFSSASGINALNRQILAEALTRKDDASRYTHIVRNVDMLMATEGVGARTFYGLWGAFHGSKTSVNGSKTLAQRMNADDAPFAGAVSTVQTLCVASCFNMMPSGAVPPPMAPPIGERYVLMPMAQDVPYIWRARGVGDLKAAIGDQPLTLIRMDAEESPYQSGRRLSGASGYLTMVTPFAYEGSMADVADYLVVMQKAPGLTPWDGQAFDVTGMATDIK